MITTFLKTAARVLPILAVLGAPLPAAAQEEVLRQNNDGQGVYWLPIISAFYAKPEQDNLQWPEGDGPPAFTTDAVKPPLHFTLNPPPADSPPTIDTDWLTFQKRYQSGEQAAAWVIAREHGKPRIWIHRAFDDEGMAGYGQSQRLLIVLEFDVVRESFPIQGQLPKPVRKQLIRDKIRVVSGKLAITEINGVKLNGSGGRPAETPFLIADFAGPSLDAVGKRGPLDFVPRSATKANGDLLDGIISVSIELELEAGIELGLTEPERKKLAGEIRFAVGKEYIDIRLLSGESQKK